MNTLVKICLITLIANVVMSTKVSSIELAPSPSPESYILSTVKYFISETVVCITQIFEKESCKDSLVRSVVAFEKQVSPKCCEDANGIAVKCLETLYKDFPLLSAFPKVIREEICPHSAAPTKAPMV